MELLKKKGRILSEPGCDDSWESWEADVNGKCPACGCPTVNGEAAYGCFFSEIICKTCKHAKCNGRC